MKYISNEIALSLLCILMIFSACSSQEQAEQEAISEEYENESTMEFTDNHSFSEPDQAVIKHLDLDVKVDFGKKIIKGVASYDIENKTGTDKIIFDTRNLKIEKVTLGEDGNTTTFELGGEEKFLGKPLIVKINPTTEKVNIYYSTNPDADALQWLSPQQTAGKKYPFLFTQSQAILARTWLPVQDSPGIRYTYDARVEVPDNLLAVMSAENPQVKNDSGVYHFKMEQPIPSYLMALSVGDLVFQSIGQKTGVYAEPSMIDKAAYEFADMEKMLTSAEKLYGPYRWERYDVIVLPPSFPFGGMENPRLTFATPTILAGDRSLTALIAHELAHSWSGNLVTNANWDDFWLNEGFTVYFENRIMEEMYGTSYANMLKELGYQDLQHEITALKEDGQYDDTSLKLALKDRDPDEGMTNIAYEKGSLMLQNIEKVIGRERFDAFLNKYFSEHAFESITTEEFIKYINAELIQGDEALAEKIQLEKWIYEPGIPEPHPKPDSERFDQVEAQIAKWKAGTPAAQLQTKDWTSHEWQHFLRNLPQTISLERLKDLDKAFNFTKTGNSEIAALWLKLAVINEYSDAYPRLEEFLVNVGRRKFLKPLYETMAKTDKGKAMAREIYAKARPNYHSVSTGTIDQILEWK